MNLATYSLRLSALVSCSLQGELLKVNDNQVQLSLYSLLILQQYLQLPMATLLLLADRKILTRASTTFPMACILYATTSFLSLCSNENSLGYIILFACFPNRFHGNIFYKGILYVTTEAFGGALVWSVARIREIYRHYFVALFPRHQTLHLQDGCRY